MIFEVVSWWLIVVALGFIALPLTRRFFTTFPDRGYILSKGVGLCAVCFINWLLCSLHILRFSIFSAWLSVLILAALAYFFKSEPLAELKTFFHEQKKLVLSAEFVFFITFILFAIIRMCNPDIASTEKMPDCAFLTGILKSGYFPPKDVWFSGGTINYFYYGHYLTALVTMLSGISPLHGYNLGIALLFGLTFTAAFGVSFGLIKRIGYGILGGAFVAFIGNLDAINQLISKVLLGKDAFYPFTWFNWWMSSRVIVREGIDITINEFPFWSYILGDLHAHVNVVPFSLLVLAIILEFVRNSGDGLDVLGKGKEKIYRLIFAALALGAIPTANTWDTPTYFALMTAAIVYGRQFHLKRQTRTLGQFIVSPIVETFHFIKKPESGTAVESRFPAWFSTWGAVLSVILCAIIFYLPFHLNFHPMGTNGLKIVDKIQRTLWDDFLTIYGFFFFCLISLVVALVAPRFKNLPNRLRPIIFGSIAGFFIFSIIIFDRFMIALCLLMLVSLFFIPFTSKDPEKKEKFFALALFLVVLLILLGCEFFYIKDAYGKTLERQNTIFKFYYQAWIFCGISSAYAVYWIRTKIKENWVFSWEVAFRFLFVATLAFPIFGTAVKTNYFAALKGNSQYTRLTLNGIWYMSWRYKGDFQTINYLNSHSKPDETVLEATGPAFSHYGRISACTGLSTVLGWANHENIWRDGTWKLVNERVSDIRTIYNTKDVALAKKLLDKYGVDYVYVGMLEREQYKNADFSKFAGFMSKIKEIQDSDGKTSILYRYHSTKG